MQDDTGETIPGLSDAAEENPAGVHKPDLAIVANRIPRPVAGRPSILASALGLLSLAAVAQGPVGLDQPAYEFGPPPVTTTMQIAPYSHRIVSMPDVVAVPACYRMGRCSAHDLYRFRDRPDRLTRLAPEAPGEADSFEYEWILLPVTPEENIHPKYRTASQVRDEFHAVGRPIDTPD